MFNKTIRLGIKSVGKVIRTENNSWSYVTERDNLKSQIFRWKREFIDGKDKYVGDNCVGISLNICKELLSQQANLGTNIVIHFIIKNYPKSMCHSIRKISLTDFLTKSITIRERGYDIQ